MKKILTVILCCFILFSCHNRNKIQEVQHTDINPDKSISETDVEKHGLSGRVKEWTRQSYRYEKRGAEVNKILLRKELYRFNESGYYVEVQGYNENNIMISKGLYKYADNGKIREELYYNGRDELLVTVTYDYNSRGNKIKEVKKDITGGFVYTSSWKFDRNGYELECIKHIKGNGQDRVESIVEKKYRSDTSISEEIQTRFGISGEMQFKKIILYNKHGDMIKNLEYNDKNILIDNCIYTYNDGGILIKREEKCYNYETKEYDEILSTYTYDSNGNLIEQREADQSIFSVYDSAGNEIEKTEYDTSHILMRKTRKEFRGTNTLKKEEIIFYNVTGEINYSYLHTYDDKENMIYWAKFDNTHSKLYEYETSYDKNGNKKEEVKDSTYQSPKIKYRYTYDDFNNHTGTQCYELSINEKEILVMSYEYIITYRE